MLKKKHIILASIFLFCLSSFYFYSPVFLNLQALKATYWGILFITILFSLPIFLGNPKHLRYFDSVRVLVITMFFSLFMAYFAWGQSPTLTLRATFPYLSYFIFFFLWRFKPEIKTIEKLIWLLCITYLICYFYALWKAPEPVFGFADRDINDMRGFMRLAVPGLGFLHLGFFLSISKYLETQKSYWLVPIIILLSIIVMHVVRQYIFFAFLIGFLTIFKKINWWKKFIVISLIIVIAQYAYMHIPALQNLVELTETQLSENNNGEENIRITSYNYFFSEFSPNFLCAIFGNGAPHTESAYGHFYSKLNYQGLFMSDVGYAQIYSLFGIFALIAIIVIFYRVIRQKVPPNYLYAKLYLIFAMLSTILSGYTLSNSNIAAIVLALYTLELTNLVQRNNSQKTTQTKSVQYV